MGLIGISHTHFTYVIIRTMKPAYTFVGTTYRKFTHFTYQGSQHLQNGEDNILAWII